MAFCVRTHFFIFTMIGLFHLPILSWASTNSEHVGILTQLEGRVQIFTHPSKTLQKSDGVLHALFEGEYFIVKDAKIGDSVEQGNILRTTPTSKVRVIYPNGDQIHVGSGTAYRIHWSENNSKPSTDIDLKYGKLRGIIEKGGPRSRLQVKTKSAVMGVRGTDFFIAGGGDDDNTEISLLRGEVEVHSSLPQTQPPKTPKKEISKNHAQSTPPSVTQKTKVPPIQAPAPIRIRAGFSAEIPVFDTKKAAIIAPKLEVRKTTKEEFAGIQKSSTIETKSSIIQAHSPELAKKLENLEKKASETTLKDIKKSDPKLFAALSKNPSKTLSVEDINKAAVAQLFKKAPKAPEKHKPYKSEIENFDDENVYKKYFKILEE